MSGDEVGFLVCGPVNGVEPFPLRALLFGEILHCGMSAHDGSVLNHTGHHQLLLIVFLVFPALEQFGIQQVGALDFAKAGKQSHDLILPGRRCLDRLPFLGPSYSDRSVYLRNAGLARGSSGVGPLKILFADTGLLGFLLYVLP